MLQIVAEALGELKNDLVFVGGAVAELYATNPAASDIRTTLDIDCIVELSSRIEHAKLEERLRAKGFANDTSQGAPICRWVYKGIKVDVMPTSSNIMGFTNRWYEEAFAFRIAITLPNLTTIFILPIEYYIATKFEAHKGRGGSDLRQSHDFEDIIFIFDNCANLIENIRNTNKSVREYLKKECRALLKNDNIIEGIESALPYGSTADSTDIAYLTIKQIAEVE